MDAMKWIAPGEAVLVPWAMTEVLCRLLTAYPHLSGVEA